MFLFQIGAIKTGQFLSSQRSLNRFLFQIGAIKTRGIFEDPYSATQCFYSRLVRLKHQKSTCHCPKSNMFLFQIGAIKTLIR